MAKVIVERPRMGSSDRSVVKGYWRRLQRLDVDELPRREGIKRLRGSTKMLNEHLGPLRRFLDSQVGRPWNKVFAEICSHINRNSAVQDHVRDHIDDFVVRHVIIIDGIHCCGDSGRYCSRYGKPLDQLARQLWYVCPRTGLLRRIKQPRSHSQPLAKHDNAPAYVRLGTTLQCRRIGKDWYLVTLEPLPLTRDGGCKHDVILDRPVKSMDEQLARKHYGAAVFALAKRRLSRRELPQYPIPIDLWR